MPDLNYYLFLYRKPKNFHLVHMQNHPIPTQKQQIIQTYANVRSTFPSNKLSENNTPNDAYGQMSIFSQGEGQKIMEFGPTKYQRVKMQARKLSIRDHLSKKSGIRRLSSQILSAQLQRSNMAEKGETEISIRELQHNSWDGKCLKEGKIELSERKQIEKSEKKHLVPRPEYINETIYPEIFPLGSRSYGTIFENYYCLILSNQEVIHVNRNATPKSSLIFAKIQVAEGIIFMQSINIFSVVGKCQENEQESCSKKETFLHINLIQYDIKTKETVSKHNLCFPYKGQKVIKPNVDICRSPESSMQNIDEKRISNPSLNSHHSGNQNFFKVKNQGKIQSHQIQETLQNVSSIRRIQMVTKKLFPQTDAKQNLFFKTREEGQSGLSTAIFSSSYTESLYIVIESGCKILANNTKHSLRGQNSAINNSIKIVHIKVSERKKGRQGKKLTEEDDYQIVEHQQYNQHLHQNETTIRKNWLKLEDSKIYFITNKAAYQVRLCKLMSHQGLSEEHLIVNRQQYEQQAQFVHGECVKIKCQNEKWLQKIMEYEWSKISRALHLNRGSSGAAAGEMNENFNAKKTQISLEIVDCCWPTQKQCLVLVSNNLIYEIEDGKVSNCLEILSLIKTREQKARSEDFKPEKSQIDKQQKTIVEIASVRETSAGTNLIFVRIQTNANLGSKRHSKRLIDSFQTDSRERMQSSVVNHDLSEGNQIYIFKHSKRWVEFHSKVQNLINQKVMKSGLPIYNPKTEDSNHKSEFGSTEKFKTRNQSIVIKILRDYNSIAETNSFQKQCSNFTHPKVDYHIFYQWGIICDRWARSDQPRVCQNLKLQLNFNSWSQNFNGPEGIANDSVLFIAQVNVFGKYSRISELNPLCIRLEDYYDPSLKSIYQIKYKCLRNYNVPSESQLSNELSSKKPVNLSSYYSFSANLFNLAILSLQGSRRKLTMFQQNMVPGTKAQHLLHVGLSTKLFIPNFNHYFESIEPTSLCIDNFGIYLVVSMPQGIRLYYILKDRISKGPELNLNSIVYLKYDRFNWHLYAHNSSIIYIIDPWKFQVQRSIAFEGHILTLQVGNQYVFVKWKARPTEAMSLTVFQLSEAISEDFKTYEIELDVFVQRDQLAQYLTACELESNSKVSRINNEKSKNQIAISSAKVQRMLQNNHFSRAELKYCFDACAETQSLFILNQYYIQIHEMKFTSVFDRNNSVEGKQSQGLHFYANRSQASRQSIEKSELIRNKRQNTREREQRCSQGYKDRISIGGKAKPHQHFPSEQNGRSRKQQEQDPLDSVRRLCFLYKLPSQDEANTLAKRLAATHEQWPTSLRYESSTLTFFVGTNLGQVLAINYAVDNFQSRQDALIPYFSEKVSHAKIQELFIKKSRFSLYLYAYTGNESVIPFSLTPSGVEILDQDGPKKMVGFGMRNQHFSELRDPTQKKDETNEQANKRPYDKRQLYLAENLKHNLALHRFKLFTTEHLIGLCQQIQQLELTLMKLKGDREQLAIKSKQKLQKELKAMQQKLHYLKVSSRLEEKKLLIENKNSLEHLANFYAAERQDLLESKSNQLTEEYRATVAQLYRQNDALQQLYHSQVEKNESDIRNFASLIKGELVGIKQKYENHLLKMETDIDDILVQNKTNEKIQLFQLDETIYQSDTLKLKMQGKLLGQHKIQKKLEAQNNYAAWTHNGNIQKVKQSARQLEQLCFEFSEQLERRKIKMEAKMNFYFVCKQLLARTEAKSEQLQDHLYHKKWIFQIQNPRSGLSSWKYCVDGVKKNLELEMGEMQKECSGINELHRKIKKQSKSLSDYVHSQSVQHQRLKYLVEAKKKYLKQLKQKKSVSLRKLESTRFRLKITYRKLSQFVSEYVKDYFQIVEGSNTSIYFANQQPPALGEDNIKKKQTKNLLENQDQFMQVVKLIKLVTSEQEFEKNRKNPSQKKPNYINCMQHQALNQNSSLISDVNKLRREAYSLQQKLRQAEEKYYNGCYFLPPELEILPPLLPNNKQKPNESLVLGGQQLLVDKNSEKTAICLRTRPKEINVIIHTDVNNGVFERSKMRPNFFFKQKALTNSKSLYNLRSVESKNKQKKESVKCEKQKRTGSYVQNKNASKQQGRVFSGIFAVKSRPNIRPQQRQQKFLNNEQQLDKRVNSSFKQPSAINSTKHKSFDKLQQRNNEQRVKKNVNNKKLLITKRLTREGNIN